MFYTPKPTTKLSILDNTFMEFRYINKFVPLDDQEIDDSHIHNCCEIYINISGDVSFLVENRLYSISHGDIIITRPNEMHLCVYNSACVHEHFCIWIHAPEDSRLLSFLKKIDNENLCTLNSAARELFIRLLYRINEIKDNDNFDLEMTADIMHLISIIENQHVEYTEKRVEMPEELTRMLDYINKNFSIIKCINDISGSFFISRSMMNRWFRKYIHMSPKKFLETKRLAYAKDLLSHGSSVNYACEKSGYNDCSHFIAMFKKSFGKTPFQYKFEKK